jgi:hypothetical protein
LYGFLRGEAAMREDANAIRSWRPRRMNAFFFLFSHLSSLPSVAITPSIVMAASLDDLIAQIVESD